MVAFYHWFTLLVGLVLMLAFVVVGLFVIADPAGFLDRDRAAVPSVDRDSDPADGPG